MQSHPLIKQQSKCRWKENNRKQRSSQPNVCDRQQQLLYHFKRLQAEFLSHPKVCLLNPAKNEHGRISKSRLDRINTNLRNLIKVNQWKDTSEIIEQFKNIGNKEKHKFTLFDIKDFYPTITKDLLTKCLRFAEEKVQISNDV